MAPHTDSLACKALLGFRPVHNVLHHQTEDHGAEEKVNTWGVRCCASR